MIPNAKRGSIFAFATGVVEAVARCVRRSAHLLVDVLQGAYDSHMEQAQMRLAHKPRSGVIFHAPEPTRVGIASVAEHGCLARAE